MSLAVRSEKSTLIFVERRLTCWALFFTFRALRTQFQVLKNVRADFVVGHGRDEVEGYLTKAPRQRATPFGYQMNTEQALASEKQKQVLLSFYSKRLNLLVCTSVLEEGIDIPSCNVVLELDFPKNFRAFIQAKV